MSEAPHSAAPAPPRLIIVTGVSGSGRATALRVLEDLGFYCVDNLPVALAPTVAKLAAEADPPYPGAALGIDARERTFFAQWPRIFGELEQIGVSPEVLFLDASDEVLARRYSESRRPHPMARGGATVADGIRLERAALAPLRERAARIIDTTALTVHELREVITGSVHAGEPGARIRILVISFGYKYGLPLATDLVFDVRFIANPHYIEDLRGLDGLDPRVHDWVMAKDESRQFVDETARLLKFLLPLYRREGKSYLTIALGCTGGRHRSPVLARELSTRLNAIGNDVQVRDQDIAR
ncbi:MAG: RNase adapter RapZ [Candidatus Binataceae bacterium]